MKIKTILMSEMNSSIKLNPRTTFIVLVTSNTDVILTFAGTP